MQDDAVLVRGDATTRHRALDELRRAGADVVRALVHHGDVVAGRWAGYDALVEDARARDLAVLFTLSPDPRGSAKAFARMAREVAGRYGTRVRLWALVNEPNSPQHLMPQRRRGRPVSPATYRRLVASGLRGLDVAGVPSRRVLIGELLGTGGDSGGPRVPVRPRAFTRAFFCLDRRDRPRRCPGGPPRRLDVAGFSFHPYPLTGGPGVTPRSRDDVTATHLGRLRRTLDAAWRAGRTARRLPLWDTEGGVQTNPPDPLFGVPPRRQARFLNEIEWALWRTPTVRSVAQYLWRDEVDRDAFQTGLRYADGRAKPSLAAYALPLHVRGGCRGARVWARLPPGARRGDLLVNGRRIRQLRASRDRTVSATVRVPRGARVRVRGGGRLSRPAAAPSRRSRSRCR